MEHLLVHRRDEPPRRCPFCHDGLSADGLVACGACGATYHAECVDRCVVLGCVGRLTPVGAPPAVAVEPEAHYQPEPRRPPAATFLWTALSLVALALALGLGVAAVVTGEVSIGVMAVLSLSGCVAFARQASPDAPAATRRAAVHARSATPPPAEPGFPAMFGARPVAHAAPPPPVDDETKRRINARRDARRPGGLGKTL